MFRGRLAVIEQTEHRLMLREKPHYGTAIVLFFFPLAAAALLSKTAPLVMFLAIPFLLLAVLPCVESTFRVQSGVLQVRRTMFGWHHQTEYPATAILTIVPRQSRNGKLLKIRFISGKEKRLTHFDDYSDLEDSAALLNRYLHAARQSDHQASNADPLLGPANPI